MVTRVRAGAAGVVDLEDAQGLPVLGWTLILRVRDTEVKHAALVAALDAEGLAGWVDLQPPTGKASLKRAVERWVKARSAGQEAEAGIETRVTIKTVNSGSDALLAYVLTAEKMDRAALRLDVDTVYRVVLEKARQDEPESAWVTKEKAGTGREIEDPALTAELRAIWADTRDLHTGTELYQLAKWVVTQSGAVPLHPGGGAFFTLAANYPTVEKLRRVLAAIGAGEGMYALPHLDVAAAREEIGTATREALKAEVEAIAKGVAYIEESGAAMKLRENTVARQLTEIRTMMDKVNAYEDALGKREGRLIPDLEALAERTSAVAIPERQPRARRVGAEALAEILPTLPEPAAEPAKKGRGARAKRSV